LILGEEQYFVWHTAYKAQMTRYAKILGPPGYAYGCQ